jgi:hypothetical protein
LTSNSEGRETGGPLLVRGAALGPAAVSERAGRDVDAGADVGSTLAAVVNDCTRGDDVAEALASAELVEREVSDSEKEDGVRDAVESAESEDELSIAESEDVVLELCAPIGRDDIEPECDGPLRMLLLLLVPVLEDDTAAEEPELVVVEPADDEDHGPDDRDGADDGDDGEDEDDGAAVGANGAQVNGPPSVLVTAALVGAVEPSAAVQLFHVAQAVRVQTPHSPPHPSLPHANCPMAGILQAQEGAHPAVITTVDDRPLCPSR